VIPLSTEHFLGGFRERFGKRDFCTVQTQNIEWSLVLDGHRVLESSKGLDLELGWYKAVTIVMIHRIASYE